MALKAIKELRDGSAAEYWRLCPDFSWNPVTQAVVARVELYRTEQARREGKRPVMEVGDLEGALPRLVKLSGAAAWAAMQTGDPRPSLYAELKKAEFFLQAEDV